MSVGLAIFVKTPGRSPVKTRLAADLGADFAVAWHRRAAATVGAVAHAAELAAQPPSALRAYWAVAEAAALAEGDWPGLPNLAQEEGGLGERMARVYAQLLDRHRAGLLIGADAPQIRGEHLLAAADWLHSDRPRRVIGPARDGGFWLFGGNRPLPLAAWTAVAYSRPDTAERFAHASAALGECLRLPELSDLDRSTDLPFVLAELAALPAPLPEQRAVHAWLAERSLRQEV